MRQVLNLKDAIKGVSGHVNPQSEKRKATKGASRELPLVRFGHLLFSFLSPSPFSDYSRNTVFLHVKTVRGHAVWYRAKYLIMCVYHFCHFSFPFFFFFFWAESTSSFIVGIQTSTIV
jgi:hypothetical protein